MNERRIWIGIIGGGVLCAAGIGALIWFQRGKIAESRENVANIRTNIDSSRKLIEGTGALEREVIVLRELSEVMKGILPDDTDVNNLVRTFQTFSEKSNVHITGLKKKVDAGSKRDKADFERVAYTLSLEGDAFQYLDFLDLIESHSRFMRVPTFRLTAAGRAQMEREGVPAHKVQVDIETFVYEPKKDEKQVKIDGYERKRDLLLGEINRRKGALTVSTYSYRGARGRRDPWIDPRVPAQADVQSTLSVQEQMDLVQQLAVRTQGVMTKWSEVQKAENVIVEMMARSEMETLLTTLEEDVRKVVTDKSIAYVPSQTRLQGEVLDPINELRTQLAASDAGRGPSENQLREVEKTMISHREAGEYKLMLDAYGIVENRLATSESDPLRKPIVERLQELAYEAHTVMDFEKIKIDVGGIVLIAGGEPVAIINGKSLTEGDLLDSDTVVRAIRRDEIEFIFHGIVFARRF